MRLTLIRVGRNTLRRSESIWNLNLVVEEVEVAAEVAVASEAMEAALGVVLVLVISNIHAKSGVHLPMLATSVGISRSLIFTAADFLLVESVAGTLLIPQPTMERHKRKAILSWALLPASPLPII